MSAIIRYGITPEAHDLFSAIAKIMDARLHYDDASRDKLYFVLNEQAMKCLEIIRSVMTLSPKAFDLSKFLKTVDAVLEANEKCFNIVALLNAWMYFAELKTLTGRAPGFDCSIDKMERIFHCLFRKHEILCMAGPYSEGKTTDTMYGWLKV